MGVRSILPSTGFAFEIPPGTYAPTWNEQQIIYVGKHGNDANSGQSIYQAKLTIQAGITQAAADGAAVNNEYTVLVLDAGVYNEDLALAQYVNIYAPEAQLTGDVTAAINTRTVLRDITPGTAAAFTLNAAGLAFLTVTTITLTGVLNGVVLANAGAIVQLRAEAIAVDDGFGISDGGFCLAAVENFALGGAGSCVTRTAAGTTEIAGSRIGHIAGGTGTVVTSTFAAGLVVLNYNVLYCLNTLTAFNVGANALLGGWIGQINSDGVPVRTINAAAIFSLTIGNYGFPNGAIKTVTNGTSPLTLLDTDSTMLIDCTGGAADAQLPLAAGRTNQRYEIKWTVAGGAARAIPSGADTIDGAAAFTFATVLDAITIQSDGVSNWRVV